MATHFNVHFNVRPRYTPGSPAAVDEEIARKVAEEEKHFIEHALSGVWGPAEKARAEKLGLRGIVEMRTERRDHWEVLDLCTGERFKRHFPEKIRKMGYQAYDSLENWEKKLIAENPPEDIENFEKASYRIFVKPFETFPDKYEIKVYRPVPIEE